MFAFSPKQRSVFNGRILISYFEESRFLLEKCRFYNNNRFSANEALGHGYFTAEPRPLSPTSLAVAVEPLLQGERLSSICTPLVLCLYPVVLCMYSTCFSILLHFFLHFVSTILLHFCSMLDRFSSICTPLSSMFAPLLLDFTQILLDFTPILLRFYSILLDFAGEPGSSSSDNVSRNVCVFTLKTRNFVLTMMNFASKTRNLYFK